VAAFPDDGKEDKDLFAVADQRLYTAKTSGRSQVCYVTLDPSVPHSKTLRMQALQVPKKEG
jgi:predicted signal transduction protein with EAL and GGDEF domain